MNTTIVLCEGPHDTAFIARVLKANGYETFNAVIKDYPPYLAEFIRKKVLDISVDGLNLANVRNGRIIPSYAYCHDNHLIVLFSVGGDSNLETRRNILDAFVGVFRPEDAAMVGDITQGETLTIVYSFDADDKGIVYRESQMQRELEGILSSSVNIKNMTYEVIDGIRLGLYIFTKEGESTGKLEDMVLPMMISVAPDIYSDVSPIVDKRSTYNLFASSKEFNHRDKAIIGMMGQLAKPGSANPAIIEQSKFLTDKIIQGDASCNKMFGYLVS